MKKFPVASRPLEYVAFLDFKIMTKQGPGYVFVAVDGFSEYAYQLGVEPEKSPEVVLKNIYFLLEHPEFVKYNQNGFTLVLQDYEDLADRINGVVHPEGGKLLFNKGYNNYIASPLLESLAEQLGNIQI